MKPLTGSVGNDSENRAEEMVNHDENHETPFEFSTAVRWAAGLAAAFICGFSFWAASSIVENKSTLAVVQKDIAVIRERVQSMPPQDYRDLQDVRFKRLESDISSIQRILEKIDSTLDSLRGKTQ